MDEVLQKHDEARAWLEGEKEYMDFPKVRLMMDLLSGVSRGLEVPKSDVTHSDVIGCSMVPSFLHAWG